MSTLSREFVYRLDGNRRLRNVGAKAERLKYLLDAGWPVPRTYVCTWEAHARYLAGDAHLAEQLEAELASKLDPTRAFAVRSSANVEDGASHSFAGQFATLLDVRGPEALVDALQKVWDSARSPALGSYLEKAGLATDDLKMGVIIQEMVAPVVSGVAFSKNPVTGLDEVIVEAVKGSGVALVQDGVRPQRWTYKWGRWITAPETGEIDRELIGQVVQQTLAIARAYGQPVDLEWVFDGQTLHWIQLRTITTLREVNLYSNRISREVLPGIIKPLVWSVNVPLVNGAWIRLFSELIGPNDLQPEELAKAFYYRAYFNMGVIGRVFTTLGLPQELLEILMGVEGGDERPRFKPSRQTLRHLPRMLRFLVDKLRYGRAIEALLPVMRDTSERFATLPLDQLDETALLDEVDQLFAFSQRAAYANVVGPLLMQVYNTGFERQLARLGVAADRFDLTRGLEGWQDYDPNPHLSALHRQYQALDPAVQRQIQASGHTDFQTLAGIEDFQQAVAAFVARFGHLSDSGNDFSQVPWREKPDFVLQMIVNYRAPKVSDEKIGWEELPVRRRRWWPTRFFYRRARQFRLYREAIGYYYTYGYGLFRNLFLALGARLAARGLLVEPADIFYVYLREVRQLVADGERAQPVLELVEERKQAIAAARDVVLPDIIYGDQPPPRETAESVGAKLHGIPTSQGYYRGHVRVVQSVNEFEHVKEGAVIVIPYSDVSWTPLIAKAGAVIAESGGTLSHSSIIAREYHLPAVVSVNSACRLLADDSLVTVDGFKGEIIVHEGTET